MKTNYDQILARVLKDEGGYSNNPADPGGPTNFGITLADYRMYINKQGTAQDVKRMTVDQAKTIYKKQYWDALNCDGLPSGVDYAVFDYGVNSGIGRAKRVLAKLSNIKDPVQLINAICDERMDFLRSLHTFSTFGAGWTRRVAGVRSYSIQLAHQPTVTPVVAHTATAAVATATTAAVLTAQPHYWPYILAGVAVVAIIGLGIYLYKKGSGQMNYLEYFHIGLPIVTLLLGLWVGHIGFSGATAQIESDIAEIKTLLHVQTATTATVVATAKPVA